MRAWVPSRNTINLNKKIKNYLIEEKNTCKSYILQKPCKEFLKAQLKELNSKGYKNKPFLKMLE